MTQNNNNNNNNPEPAYSIATIQKATLGTLAIPDAGNVQIQVQYGALYVRGHQSVLFNGMLHSVEATYAQHEGRWYPVNQRVLTGSGLSKRATKATDTLLATITEQVNDFIANNPEALVVAAREQYLRTGSTRFRTSSVGSGRSNETPGTSSKGRRNSQTWTRSSRSSQTISTTKHRSNTWL